MILQYTCPSKIELIEMDQEWIVMDTEGFTITKINRMGAYILEALMAHKTVDEIVDMIGMNYEVKASQARAETMAFLQQLQRIGIIHESSF